MVKCCQLLCCDDRYAHDYLRSYEIARMKMGILILIFDNAISAPGFQLELISSIGRKTDGNNAQ